MPGGAPENQVPSEVDVAQPSASLTPDVPYDNPVAGAVQYAGELALREQRYADQAAVVGAQNQLTALDQEKLYHPKTGLLNQNLGKDAPAAADKTLSDYEAARSKIREGLGNERQKTLFDRTSTEHMRTVQRQVYGYEHEQFKQWDANNVTSAVEMAQQQAVATYGLPHDPGQGDPVDHQVETQKALLTDYGQRQHWPQSTIDLKTKEAVSKTYVGVIDDLLAKEDSQGAQAMLDAHGTDILPAERDSVLRQVRASSTANEAQTIANFALMPDENGTVRTPAEFQHWVDNNPQLQGNAKLYDEVARRGDEYYARKQRAEVAQNKQTFDGVFESLKDKSVSITDPAIQAQLAKLPPEMQEHLAAYYAKDGAIHTNPVQMNSLSLLAASNPEEFLAVDKTTLVTQLAPADYEKVVHWDQEIRARGVIGDAPGIITKQQVFDDGLSEAGFSTTSKDGRVTINRNAPGAVAFLKALDARIVVEEQAKKRALVPKEMQQVKDDMLVERVSLNQWGRDPNVPAYQVTEAQAGSAYRDLGEIEKADPARAAQVRANIAQDAQAGGYDSTRLTPDQYNRAFAQKTLIRDRLAAGDRAGAERARTRLQAILAEKAYVPLRLQARNLAPAP